MRIAQKLYEAGSITYMRTDSTRISEQAHKSIKDVIEKSFGSDLYERKDYVQNSPCFLSYFLNYYRYF